MEVKSYRVHFIYLFLFFGGLIALFTSLVHHQLDSQNIHQAFREAAVVETASKRKALADFKATLENYLISIKESSSLRKYLVDPSDENYAIVADTFYTLARSNPNLMQIRFLDHDGKERIRVEHSNDGGGVPVIVAKKNLQNKKDRYYYLEASRGAANSFWYSRLDLNVEKGKIQIPFKPVMRIATPVYIYKQYLGVVVVNVHAQSLLDNLRESSFFNVSLIDGQGEFIVHYDDTFSWSRYLHKKYNVFDELPAYANAIVHSPHGAEIERFGTVYLTSLGALLPHDMASLLISPKENALERMQEKNRKGMVFVVTVILLLSVPLAILLAQIPVRLNRRIAIQTKVLSEYVTLIDENIPTSTTDENFQITNISSAYSELCGYSKAEIVKQDYSLLRSTRFGEEFYIGIRRHLSLGQTWHGELLQQTKDGREFWTNTTIHSRLDEDGKKSYWALHFDITDKKELEVTAITDELTSLFNRRHFNSILEQELERARRLSTMLCFAILDVDHFKQYNDNYGHQKGDYVLTAIGKLLQNKLNRVSDFTFRLGGEEFGFLFNGMEEQGAVEFAESVRRAVGELKIEHNWSKVAPVVTVSMGLLCIVPGVATTTDEIYRIGDEALYKAKAEGRDTLSVTYVDDSV